MEISRYLFGNGARPSIWIFRGYSYHLALADRLQHLQAMLGYQFLRQAPNTSTILTAVKDLENCLTSKNIPNIERRNNLYFGESCFEKSASLMPTDSLLLRAKMAFKEASEKTVCLKSNPLHWGSKCIEDGSRCSG